MRRRFRYDADLDAVVEIGNYFEEKPQSGPNVIGDDVGAGVNGLMNFPSGKMLDSKSQHRAENRARGAEEVGNETNFASPKPKAHPDDYMRMVIDSKQQIAGNWNGTADWLKSQRRNNG